MSNDGAPIGRILVGIDGSKGSQAALRWTARLAASVGAEVVAVHAVELGSYDTLSLRLPLQILNEAEWREAIRSELEGTWCEPLAQAGVRHRVSVVDGRAGPALAQAAQREEADLLVTGRRGLTGVAEMVHGSVSHYLSHHAPCPLAVVPAPNCSLPS